jgi:hypothetical protein
LRPHRREVRHARGEELGQHDELCTFVRGRGDQRSALAQVRLDVAQTRLGLDCRDPHRSSSVALRRRSRHVISASTASMSNTGPKNVSEMLSEPWSASTAALPAFTA